jgi:hypothetical protein
MYDHTFATGLPPSKSVVKVSNNQTDLVWCGMAVLCFNVSTFLLTVQISPRGMVAQASI